MTIPVPRPQTDGEGEPSASDAGEEDGEAGLDDPAVREALQRESRHVREQPVQPEVAKDV